MSVFALPENEDQGRSKQDCEQRAFYRLAPKIKKAFPQLPICFLLDGLFAGKPVFDVCEKYHWKYFITFKEGSIPAQWQEFLRFFGTHLPNTYHFALGKSNFGAGPAGPPGGG